MKKEELAKIQNPDGGFGRFHSMSTNSPITTEKALRRFWFLNLNKDYPILSKCLEYVRKCLYKEIVIPDRREKVINWDVFEELMFSSWLNLFKVEDEKVSSIQLQWKSVIENSIIDNQFDYTEYKKQYRLLFGNKGLREISPSNFYMVCLLKNMLTPSAKNAYFQYLMEKGIYYIYDKNLYELPKAFDSKSTISHLIAIKLVADYAEENELDFVKDWLYGNRNSNGQWEMPSLKPDGVVFPVSDNWRKGENKKSDINRFIKDVICSL
ncbi:MAG: hypothetical protein PHG08_08870 [Bacilli bacterium]|jgi:hypothetical protein|nr:hypothetical protein [Bacilli bacterium]HHU23950.1 hypothetical protein [Acholeplasmataceae bacterium]